MAKKKICIITGSRSEYGILKPILREVVRNRALELRLVVAGMHLVKEFGETFREIRTDGFKVDATVPMTSPKDTSASMALSVGIGTQGMVRAFQRIKPDIVLVSGDRVEALAAALAAVYMNIPVAHVHGGERSGTVDENARHAITKLAHIHFASTKQSKERILKMGEQKNRVYVVGAPGLDDIHTTAAEQKRACIKYGITRPFILLSQHSSTTQAHLAGKQIQETLDALVPLNLPILAVYPSADAGGRSIVVNLLRYSKRYAHLKIYPSIPRTEFLALLAAAAVLVGNSSGGIIEAPYLRVPVVNIGERQRGREHSGGVVSVPHERRAIACAVQAALKKKRLRVASPYGSGRAGKKIAALLARVNPAGLLEKRMTY